MADNGFSFGVSSPGEDNVFEDADAVEVGGDPVSRNEAKSMGMVQFDKPRKGKGAAAKKRLGPLPPEVSPGMAAKLERALDHLARDEIEKALTLAQEVVWEHPTLAVAKLIIARCFINRKEYEKGLAILQAMEEQDRTAEVLYYTGLCLSRLHRIKDAIGALKASRAGSGDTIIRKRSHDLLSRLQGERIACPVCGKKVLPDSLVEAGNQTVCAKCAKRLSDAADDDDSGGADDDYDDADDGTEESGRRRKRLRPPLSKTDMLIRAVFALFLFGLVIFGGYILYMVAPEHYATVRSYLPAWDIIPPAPPLASGVFSQPAGQPPVNDNAIRVVPSLVLDAAPIERAMAKVELRHQVRIGPYEGKIPRYEMAMHPPSDAPPRFDPATGDFVWTPSEQDAGKQFELIFSAAFDNIRSANQTNVFTVRAGPDFRRIGSWPDAAPEAALHMIAEDITENDGEELFMVSGDYWTGNVALLRQGADGVFAEAGRIEMNGRPAGAGIIMAGEEKWLAVADFWNSSLRHFTYRSNAMSEMAVTIPLPGRPILAAFDKASSVSMILCQAPDSQVVVAYKQEGQINSRKIGEWPLPDGFTWRRLVVLGGTADSTPSAVLCGGDFANSLFVLEPGKESPTPLRGNASGTFIDAVPGGQANQVLCLVEADGLLSLYQVNIGSREFAGVKAGSAPALCGLAAANFYRADSVDAIALGSAGIGIAFGADNGWRGDMTHWPLPAPARLFGRPAPFRQAGGGDTRSLIYMDDSGGLWRMNMRE